MEQQQQQLPPPLPTPPPLQKLVRKLPHHQRQVCHRLKSVLEEFLRRRPELDNNGIYNWDPLTWHNTIIHMAQAVGNQPRHADDCIMTGGTKSLKITPVEYRCDSPQQGTRLLAVRGAGTWRVTLYRLSTVLGNPERLEELQQQDRRLQAAHRCKHKSLPGRNPINPCYNPEHLVLAGDAENKSMDRCWNGAAFLCPHQPRCVWTSATGAHLPCRNDPAPPPIVACTHTPNCWDPTTLG